MKILAIHNFHRKGSASGDDQVFRDETALLEAHGHAVIRYTVSNDAFDAVGLLGKLRATAGMLWSRAHYRAVRALIQKERPDIVHIHTFFPLLSPSVLYAAKRLGVPVVATLHDTRFVCPCATSLRDGKLCNACGDGHYLRMAKYGCFKGSRAQSLIVAGIFAYHRLRRSFYKQIDRYICLNDEQIGLLTGIGFDPAKIVKKYNFVPEAHIRPSEPCRDIVNGRYVVYFGRLGEEKGVRVLMRLWEAIEDIPLVVMGGGPLEDEFRQWAQSRMNVHFLGYTPHETCLAIVHGAAFVVFPSIWYEGCSMVEIEALSLGKGLVATDLGFSREAIADGVNGYRVALGDDAAFIRRIRALWDAPDLCDRLGRNARRAYEASFLPEDNYDQLMGIYRALVPVVK